MSHAGTTDHRKRGRGTFEGRQRRRLRPTLLALEDRRLLTTFTVNSTLDDGSDGTLRWAVGQANSTGGADTIDFDSTVFNTPQTITLGGTQLELSDTTGATTITGPAAGVTVSGGGPSRVFQVDAGVTASLSGLTITGGSAVNGGGLYNNGGSATLTGCTISGNSAVNNGGGVGCSNSAGGTLTLTNCTVSGNTSGGGRSGGGLYLGFHATTATLTNCTISDNSSTGSAGGLCAVYDATTLTNCTISGNSSTGIGGSDTGGGGLYINNGYVAGTTTLTNCTISGNTATGNGGGMHIVWGTTTLTNCTVSGNTAGGPGGGLYIFYENSPPNHTTVTFGNTIVAGNTTGTSGPDVFVSGSVVSQGNNLIGETDGSSGWVGSDLTGTVASPLNPLLAPLGDYGGPTQTMALLPGSPALGAGISGPGIPTTDQRGAPRGSLVDIGAFQASLVVMSTSGTVDITAANLTLPGAALFPGSASPSTRLSSPPRRRSL